MLEEEKMISNFFFENVKQNFTFLDKHLWTMSDTLEERSRTLDSDDDDVEISSTKQKSSTKDDEVVVEHKSVGDLDDVFDQSDENEHQRTWKTFDRYTSKFFKVRHFRRSFCLRFHKKPHFLGLSLLITMVSYTNKWTTSGPQFYKANFNAMSHSNL